MAESINNSHIQIAKSVSFIVGVFFALAFFWVECGGMLMGGRMLTAYPSGWPTCHSVFHRANGNFEFNFSAAVVNALACGLMLISTVVVSNNLLSVLQGKGKLALSDFLKLMTTIAILCAWASNEKVLANATLGHFWVTRPLLSPRHLLTHWTLSNPTFELSLRLTILIAVGCLIYSSISILARIQRTVSIQLAKDSSVLNPTEQSDPPKSPVSRKFES